MNAFVIYFWVCEGGGLTGITCVKRGLTVEEEVLIVLLRCFSDGSVSYAPHVTSIPKKKLRWQVSKMFYQEYNSGGAIYIVCNTRSAPWSSTVK